MRFPLYRACVLLAMGLVPSLVLAPAASAGAGGKGGRLRSGGVHGRATYSGPPPKAIILPMGSDPKCLEQHPHGFRFTPVEVGKGGGLADVFVYVKSGLEGKKFESPKEEPVLFDQRGCWYYPRVAGAMVGEKVWITNSDPVFHNVDALPEFNGRMPAGLKKIEETFHQPAVMRQIKCDVHPWMKAYVGVLEHPFFAVTGKDGSFSIPKLPPGRYVLEAWHERLGVLTKEVTVGKGGAVEADFAFTDKGDKS